jgi:hypothetical protein
MPKHAQKFYPIPDSDSGYYDDYKSKKHQEPLPVINTALTKMDRSIELLEDLLKKIETMKKNEETLKSANTLIDFFSKALALNDFKDSIESFVSDVYTQTISASVVTNDDIELLMELKKEFMKRAVEPPKQPKKGLSELPKNLKKDLFVRFKEMTEPKEKLKKTAQPRKSNERYYGPSDIDEEDSVARRELGSSVVDSLILIHQNRKKFERYKDKGCDMSLSDLSVVIGNQNNQTMSTITDLTLDFANNYKTVFNSTVKTD